MVSEPFKHVLRVVGWAVIPNRVTEFLLPYYAQIFGLRIAPGTPDGRKAYQRVYSLVIGGYLAYNLYQAAFNQPPNLYQLLGVGIDADEGQLKTAFRNFARKYHPDKVGPSGEPLFMAVRGAYESLKHPVKRFAYDRFGSDTLSWERLATYKEYLERGLWQSCGFYLGTGFMMAVYAFLGQSDSGTVWRMIIFAYVAFAELMLCVQPPPLQPETTASSIPLPEARSPLTLPLAILRFMFPHWVPYQHVSFLHEIFITVSLAIARIGPVVFADEAQQSGAVNQQIWAGLLGKIGHVTQVVEAEVDGMLRKELTAMRGPMQYDAQLQPIPRPEQDEATTSTLSRGLEQVLIESHVRSHPMLRTLWDEAVRKGREVIGLGPSATMIEIPDDVTDVDKSEASFSENGRASLSPGPSPMTATFPDDVRVKPEEDLFPSMLSSSSRYIMVDSTSPPPSPAVFDSPGHRSRRTSSQRIASPTRLPSTPSSARILESMGSSSPSMRLRTASSAPTWIKEEVVTPLGDS